MSEPISSASKPPIHIAIAFDANYLMPFCALTASIFANNLHESLHFHIIATGIDRDEKQRLKNYIQAAGAEIIFYDVDEAVTNRFILVDNWTSAVYYRLFFPLLVSGNITRLLYIDADAIVNKSLAELFASDLEKFPLGAVYDNYVKTQPLLNITNEGEYFNSGVLLIDLKLWREQQISERAIEYLTKYKERIRFVDQCALNAVLYQNWKRLPEKYNLLYSFIPETLSLQQIPAFLMDKVIIHYTLHRPWHFLCKNRLKFLYHRYLKLSPFGKHERKYTDFTFDKLPALFRIKLFHFYLDFPGLANFWRKVKKIITVNV